MSEIPKRFWNEYQKEIADDHYFYERSCIRQTFFPGSEAAFLKIMREELGKDIKDEAYGDERFQNLQVNPDDPKDYIRQQWEKGICIAYIGGGIVPPAKKR